MRILIFTLCFVLCHSIICHADSGNISCHEKCLEVTEDSQTLEETISRWQQCRHYCSNDGSFEENYATILFKYGKHKEALEYLSLQSKKYKRHQVPKRIIYANGELHFLLGNIDTARQIGDDLAIRYIDWYGGYSLLGMCAFKENKFKEARYYLSNAIRKDEGMSALNFSNLIKADMYLHLYEEIVTLFNIAEHENLDLVHNKHEASLCAAIAMIETGRHDDGRELMLVQSKLDPNIAEHTGYKEAIRTYEKATGKPFNGQ